jgi:hypothetical protein
LARCALPPSFTNHQSLITTHQSPLFPFAPFFVPFVSSVPAGSQATEGPNPGGAFFLFPLLFAFLCVLCGEHLSFVAAHHANYGRPKSRTDNPQATALFSPCPWRLALASFPLCVLCAFVVNVFSFFDHRRTTTAHGFARPSSVCRLPSSVCRLPSHVYRLTSFV